MYRSFLLASALAAAAFSSHSSQAQQTVHQVLVLNEGYINFSTGEQEVPVTLGSYDPVTGIYHTVATIPDARFGSHVLVNGSSIYVAADSFLLKYNADSYVLEAQTVIVGIRAFAFWNDEIVVTRGETGGLPNYVEVRDKNSLEPVYAVSTIDLPYSCEDVEVVGDMAYIAVNNAFDWANPVGMLGKLNLASGQWEGGIDLGPDGLNPENVMVEGDRIYTLNNRDFSSSSISKVGLTSGTLEHTNVVTDGGGCNASELMSTGRIYFMEYNRDEMARYDLNTDQVQDTLAGSIAPYGLLENPIDHVIYATTTDYFSTGSLNVLSYDGAVLSSVPVSVSPGSLALDVRLSTSVSENSQPDMMLYPNPSHDAIFVRMPSAKGRTRVVITDATGRVIMDAMRAVDSTQRFDVSGFASGVYTLRAGNGKAVRFTVN